MKKYLSFGGGVNSVAMMLMLLDQHDDFEAIFVDHGTDWPETYEYFEMFQAWLKDHGHRQITVLKPDVEGYQNLYDYYLKYKMTPTVFKRICTDKFKVTPIHKYVTKPCFMLIGIDAGEPNRAKISTEKGIEKRYPLLENNINRTGCKKIIAGHGLPIPMKSGCYICPFQKANQWKELRKNHPDLFCKASTLEKINMQYRKDRGKKSMTLCRNGKSLETVVDEHQGNLFEQDNYPPCQCGL